MCYYVVPKKGKVFSRNRQDKFVPIPLEGSAAEMILQPDVSDEGIKVLRSDCTCRFVYDDDTASPGHDNQNDALCETKNDKAYADAFHRDSCIKSAVHVICNKNANPFDKYEVVDQDLVGTGMFGSVKRVQEKSTGRLYAMKITSCKNLYSKEEVLAAEHEASIMSRLSHSGIVGYKDSYFFGNCYYLIMELIEGEDLATYMSKPQNRLGASEDDVKAILCEVLGALKYMNKECGLIHGDIKLENVLIASSGITTDNPAQVKLVDFGTSIAMVIDPSGEEMPISREVVVGTHGYIAPEILTREGITSKSDIWSVGIMAFYLLSGYHPFFPYSTCLDHEVDFSDRCWTKRSDAAREFVHSLLVVDPSSRPTAEEALKHPWFRIY